MTIPQLHHIINTKLPTNPELDTFLISYFSYVDQQTQGLGRQERLNLLFRRHKADEIVQALQAYFPDWAPPPDAATAARSAAPGERADPPAPGEPRRPARVVALYVQSDSEAFTELAKQLSLSRDQIALWGLANLKPGERVQETIDQRIRGAAVVLLLLSADFLDSDEAQRWMRLALDRARAGQLRVVPVPVRACLWQSSELGRLHPLPADGRLAQSDDGWVEVAEGLGALLAAPKAVWCS